MNDSLKALLKKPAMNEWRLFWLVFLPICTWVLWNFSQVDSSQGEGISSMIAVSVRMAVPFLCLAFAASSVQVLFPGALSLWWLRNRRIFGLLFSGAMAWQALFILWLVTVHRDYYVAEVYVLRDVIEGVIGYTFLIAMTVTSFMSVRKKMRPKHWKWLHTIGIYSLWVYVFSTYWWSLSYYDNPTWLDYFYYWLALLAWCLRALAWRKKRSKHWARQSPPVSAQPVLEWLGAAVVLLGLVAANTGVLWQAPSEALLTGYQATRWAELYLPYWPFEPFLPLVVVAIGLWISARPAQTEGNAVSATKTPAGT